MRTLQKFALLGCRSEICDQMSVNQGPGIANNYTLLPVLPAPKPIIAGDARLVLF